MKVPTFISLSGIAVALALSSPAGAADLAPVAAEPPPPVVLGNDWHFQATLYGWATAIDGDVGIRNLPTADVNLSFFDILQNLDGALMGSLYASNGQFSVLTDLVYANISDNIDVGQYGGSVKFKQEQVIASGIVGIGCQSAPPISISAPRPASATSICRPRSTSTRPSSR